MDSAPLGPLTPEGAAELGLTEDTFAGSDRIERRRP